MKLSHVVAGALLIAGIGGLIVSTVHAQERQECATWTREASSIARWYSTDWQRAQCHAYGVNLPDEARYIEVLRVEAPETLIAPTREQFADQQSYEKAQTRFKFLGYWGQDQGDERP